MEHVRVRGAARTGAGVRGTGARGDACDGPCDAVDAGAAGRDDGRSGRHAAD